MEISCFQPISRFISETIQNVAIVTMEDEYAIYQMMPFPVTLSDRKLDCKVTISFNVI